MFGNVDGDREKMREFGKKHDNLKIHGEVGELEFPITENTLLRSAEKSTVFF